MKDGELTGDMVNGARWCASCNQNHGPLYDCLKYPEEVRDEIAKETLTWRLKLVTNEDNLPPEVLAIHRFFAGID